jgi:UMF1 family MFS transporter
MISVLIGVFACGFLWVPSSWLMFLVVFIVAKVGYNISLIFYDAMLPDVTTPERLDRVSSNGYAWGYIGSCIPFAVSLVFVLMYESFGMTIGTAMIIAFVLNGAWWLLMTLPLLKDYKQLHYIAAPEHPLQESVRRIVDTLKDIKGQKHIFMYLLAFFFFIDGVYTIIEMATAYGSALGLDTAGLLLALLVTQIVAFPFAILFGRLATKYDTGLLIKICIACYTGIAIFAIFLATQWQFWTLAVLVGMFQGGIQALSRSYLGKIVPAEQSGEFYGLMDICGKGASFFGMALVGFINQITTGIEVNLFGLKLQNANIAVSVLLVLFAIGYALFCKADKLNKERQA